ncbi:MAG: hypothetical protein ABFD14_03930 [Anaerolineaceae bacterium]
MIPEAINIGASWKVLPQGVFDANLEEIESRFATNQIRRHLMKGLCKACKALRKAGCKVVYVDGSFVSEKTFPGDYDVCWDPTGVDVKKLDLVFLDFSNGRKKQKLKYFGEFFPSSANADGSHTYLQFFRIEKETGLEKGIVRILLQ